MRAFAAAFVAAFLLTAPAYAQAPAAGNRDTTFGTPGNSYVPGLVQMCLNASNQAIPCSTPPQGTPATGYPAGATAITGNATGSTGSVVGTLAAASGKFTYICGFTVSATGGTATLGPITIAGLIGSSQVYQLFSSATGVTLTENFFPCIQGSAVNTAITTTTTADATATAVDVNSWGYQE